MPSFDEKKRLISELRNECRECDERVYKIRLQIHNLDREIRRSQEGRTTIDVDRDRLAADLRRSISDISERLERSKQEQQKLKSSLAEFDEKRGLAGHLERNVSAIKGRIAATEAKIDELRRERSEDRDAIEQLGSELRRLRETLAELESEIRKLRQEIDDLRDEEDRKRCELEESEQGSDRLREELQDQHARLVDALQPAFANTSETSDRLHALRESETRFTEDCGDCKERLHNAIADLYSDLSPQQAVRNLDDRTPFLLFPVRLETIFVPTGENSNELWVRVYPDDILVHTHEKVLTDREVVAGELYWTELFTAEHLDEEKDNRRRAAWRHIVELFGGQRAAWVSSNTKPSDWDAIVAGPLPPLTEVLKNIDPQFFDKLLALNISVETRADLEKAIAEKDDDLLSRLAEKNKWFDLISPLIRTLINEFPDHDLTSTESWTRAPRTKLLPDRFVLMLFGDASAPPRELLGEQIPDTVFLGPDPLDAKKSFEGGVAETTLTYGKSFEWMSNFDRAVEQGMGFRVTLSESESRRGFKKILVLGLFLSANAVDGAALVEELIDNHRFGPNGFSIVPQGTPTNNTEQNGTGYSDNDPYDDLAFFTSIDSPAFDPNSPDPKKSRTDGRILADALGIGYGSLESVQNAGRTDVIDAKAMNTALFPGTLGYWLKRWMSPVVPGEIARETRRFFTDHVTGRGPLPSIRIGDQPYGILLTSDFSKWRYREEPGGIAGPGFSTIGSVFLRKLYRLLAALEKIWDVPKGALPFVGKPGLDPSDALLKILAVHPNSVEFFQRVGYSHTYLRNQANFKDHGAFKKELEDHMLQMPGHARSFLMALGLAPDDDKVGDLQSIHVLWQHYITALDVPNLIENAPLSEENGLAVNYIDLLASAETTQKIIDQDVPGEPPSALLYLMLRNALLLQLHNGTYEWLEERTDFDELLVTATRETTLPQIRISSPNLSRYEIMTTRIGVAEPEHPVHEMSVADWIWGSVSSEENEFSYLNDLKASLEHLKTLKTAELERCFVEHLDCCSYRLDAWQTGLFSERLVAQRRSETERVTGIHLGAFGWVEDLRPKAKRFIDRSEVAESLRPNDSHPIIEEDDVGLSGRDFATGTKQAGFVHAPSLNHAAAAALLRNAYLSHASPEKAEMFSVNLSSERVRRGEFILQGMRNGQSIEALLGYQFERGLHDRTSESIARGDSPVLELNRFIQTYREAFNFESVEVPQAGSSGPIETVPPYNVVNGLKMSESDLTAANGYGTSGILAGPDRPNAVQGAAIVAERDRLRDSIDAVKDLLMAENAYQLARGNLDRVAAVSLAQKDAHIPPELEVINTPRGTEFSFTNRVTLHFEDLDPTSAANDPWPDIALTPRAVAETGINMWLGGVLPGPEAIKCKVYWTENNEDENADLIRNDELSISVRDLELQPIDLISIFNIGTSGSDGATELETRIASHYRRTLSVPDDKLVKIEFDLPKPAGQFSFAEIFPLARQLRSLLTSARAIDAEDFLPVPSNNGVSPSASNANPKGFDLAELKTRVENVISSLSGHADGLYGAGSPGIEVTILEPDGTVAESFTDSLGNAFTKLDDKKLSFADKERVAFSFTVGDAETLRSTLVRIAGFGIQDSFPAESDLTVEAAKAGLLSRAHTVARRLRSGTGGKELIDSANEQVSAAANKPVEDQVQLLLDAGKSILGSDFTLLPKFTYRNETDIVAADADRSQLLAYIRGAVSGSSEQSVLDEWLEGAACVRRPLKRWLTMRTLADALNDKELDLRPVQLPYRANDSWLAVEFPEKDPNNTDPANPDKPFGISRDTLSIVAHGKDAFRPGSRQSGILLDDWTEEIPTDSETTGIAFRFNQPNASPPQTLLLAVTPEETGAWSWDDLVGTLKDTLERAKRRAVEPSQLEPQGMAWNAFAPALVSEFSAIKDSDVSLDLMEMIELKKLKDFYVSRF